VRRALEQRLPLAEHELPDVLALVASQLDLSLERLVAASDD
jgi:hypothetical protein